MSDTYSETRSHHLNMTFLQQKGETFLAKLLFLMIESVRWQSRQVFPSLCFPAEKVVERHVGQKKRVPYINRVKRGRVFASVCKIVGLREQHCETRPFFVDTKLN